MSPRFPPSRYAGPRLIGGDLGTGRACPACSRGRRPASELLTFDIPAAPVGQVLTRLANETGILLAAPPQLLAGRQQRACAIAIPAPTP